MSTTPVTMVMDSKDRQVVAPDVAYRPAKVKGVTYLVVPQPLKPPER